MSISPRGREAAAVVVALAAHLAILAAPVRERAVEVPAAPPDVVDGIDLELEEEAPQAGSRAAPPAVVEPEEAGKTAPVEKARAPVPGTAAAKIASAARARPAPSADEYGGPPPAAAGGVALAPGLGAPVWTMPGVLPSAEAPRPDGRRARPTRGS